MQSNEHLSHLSLQIRDILSSLSKTQKRSSRQSLILKARSLTLQLSTCISSLPQFDPQRKRLQTQLKRITQTIDRQAQRTINYDDNSQSFVRNKQQSKPKMTERESSRAILTKMIEIEMRQADMKIKPQEIQEIADKMEQNLEIMKEINQLVNKGGEDIDVITEKTLESLERTKEARKEIEEADQEQLRGIMLKVRMGIGSVLALIGAKIFGMAGGVAGFFTGFFGFK